MSRSLLRLSNLRRVVQVLVFLVFIVVLIRTVSPIETWLPPDFLLRFDPLAAISTALSSRDLGEVFPTFVPALVVVVLTLVVGRFFCNWVCPLGTTLDVWQRLVRRGCGAKREPRIKHTAGIRNLKYYILGGLLIAAVLSTQVAWVLDPIPIATRSYGVVVYPYLSYAANAILGPLWQAPMVSLVSEPVYSFLKRYVLFPNPDIGYLSITAMHQVAFGFFAAILMLSLFQARFWCRYLCPLGALFGFLSKMSLLRWTVDTAKCTECNRCVRECKTAAILEKGDGYIVQECVECMNCPDVCPTGAIGFRFQSPGKSLATERQVLPEGLDLSKRRFLTSAVLAAVTVPFFKIKPTGRDYHPLLIRPPGAVPEEEFLDRCIRCAECMKVCPTNALQPAAFEGGLEAIGTPKLVPQLGYCDYECNACSLVCPTGAIRQLPLAEKKETKIGTAYFNKNKCYPWNENLNCLVCEEHCPTPEKSIKFWDVEVPEQETNKLILVKRPYVVTEMCIGCGICEEKCPLKDEPGIRVTARGEDRHAERYSGGRGV